jgi:hypothetical protein
MMASTATTSVAQRPWQASRTVRQMIGAPVTINPTRRTTLLDAGASGRSATPAMMTASVAVARAPRDDARQPDVGHRRRPANTPPEHVRPKSHSVVPCTGSSSRDAQWRNPAK